MQQHLSLVLNSYMAIVDIMYMIGQTIQSSSIVSVWSLAVPSAFIQTQKSSSCQGKSWKIVLFWGKDNADY